MEIIFFFILYNLFLGLYLIILESNIFYTLLYMVLIFLINSIGLIFLGFDFLGFMILIVYVGAIVILFLFVFLFLNYFNIKLYNTITIFQFFSGCILIYFLNYLFSYNFDIFYTSVYFYCYNLSIQEIGILLYLDNNYCLILFIGLFLFIMLLIIIKLLTIENLKRQIILI